MVNISKESGAGPSGVGIPRVTVSQEDTAATSTLNSANPFNGSPSLAIALTGKAGVGGNITAAVTASVIFEYSPDGGVNYLSAVVIIDGAQVSAGTLVIAGIAHDVQFICGEHWTHVRVRVTAYTSGSATVNLHATNIVSPLAVGALASGVIATQIPIWANLLGLKAVTGALTAASANGLTVPGIGDVYGRQVTRKRDTFALTSAPAAATQATVSQAAGAAGVKNVCTSVAFSLTFAGAPTAGIVQFNLRDGATGAGTILQTYKMSVLATSLTGVSEAYGDLWIEGTAATAMTFETAAAPGAAVVATVSFTGTISQ